jgi:hypothetical protein
VGHEIQGLVLAEPCDARAAEEWGVVPVPLRERMCLVHISHYFTAYWQKVRGVTGLLDVPRDFPAIFPREAVVLNLATALTGDDRPTFALIMTEYHHGLGDQWAAAFVAGRPVPGIRRINDALGAIGVRRARPGCDEFDTVGLGAHREDPDWLLRFDDLADEVGA